jgi:hypothetical protein
MSDNIYKRRIDSNSLEYDKSSRKKAKGESQSQSQCQCQSQSQSEENKDEPDKSENFLLCDEEYGHTNVCI